MITKALIIKKISDDCYQIRIPTLDKVKSSSLNSNELQVACASKQVSGDSNFNQNDVVYVEFEDNDIYNPVILGKLYVESNLNSLQDFSANSLTVTNSARLSNEIVINNKITYDNIKNLIGTSDNIQKQINDIISKLKTDSLSLDDISNKYKSNEKNLKTYKASLELIKDNLDKVSKIFGNINDGDESTLYGKLNILSKNINELESKIGPVDNNTNILNEIQDLQTRLIALQNISPNVQTNDEEYVEPIPYNGDDSNNYGYTPAQSAKFDDLLAALRSKFPHGKYWNHMPRKGTGEVYNNQDGWTNIPCSTHNNHCGTDKQTCNGYAPAGYETSWQCMGYANKCGYDMTGYDPETSSKWKKATNVDQLSKLKKGDIVRYKNDGHSIYVTNVSGSTVTYTDCNSDSHCVIKWDKNIDKSTLSKSFTYIRVSPTDYSKSRLLT